MSHPLFLVDYLEKKHHQILVHFHMVFVFQSLLKDEAVLKTPFITPFPALYIPFLGKRFPNKLAPNVPNNKRRNPPFCSFTSF